MNIYVPFAERLGSLGTSNALVFQNAGLIDLAAVTTMGVSVKEGDAPIGFFGTGVKFAIATILRSGGSVELYRGCDHHVFGVEADTVRGEAFDFVTLDGARLGFTTQLGRTWEPWMAFRELASNCRDEGGRYFVGEWAPAANFTTFVVSGRALAEVWPDRHSIMLESAPLYANEHIEVHPGHGDFVFYRGVRIYTPHKPTVLRYNIRDKIALTEDRTAASNWQVHYAIERGLAEMEDEKLLRRALICGTDFLEYHLDLGEYGVPSGTFRALATELSMGPATCTRTNPKVVGKARAWALDTMQPGDGLELEPHQEKMLERAKHMLRQAGFAIDTFPLLIADSLGPNVCGAAKDGKIFLSRLPFQKGTREVAATLLEEYAHLRSGASDCTRDFQNWLFDQMLVQAERISGEPF